MKRVGVSFRDGADLRVSSAHRLRQRLTAAVEAKARQARKIRELKAVLVGAGLITLDEQARALGLCRSTTWTILRGDHKASGLSAMTVGRTLSTPELPPLVRTKSLEYMREKTSGLHGHSDIRMRNFSARIQIQNGIVVRQARCNAHRRSITKKRVEP